MMGIYVEVTGSGHARGLKRIKPNQISSNQIKGENGCVKTPPEHPRGQNYHVVPYAYSPSTVHAGNSSAN